MRKNKKWVNMLLFLTMISGIELYFLVKIYDMLGGWVIFLGITTSMLIGGQILFHLYFQLSSIRNELKNTEVGQRGEKLFDQLLLPFLRGSLLVFPGFLTDFLALLCFWPHLAKYLIRYYPIKIPKN